MRAAVVQMSLVPDCRAHNLRRALDMLARASELDPPPDVICLPARAGGYVTAERIAQLSRAGSDGFVEILAAKARDLGVSVVFGFVECEQDRYYDAGVWIDADGDVLIRQRKSTLTESEREYLAAGPEPQAVDTLFGKVGVLPSKDAANLDSIRQLLNQEAGLIITPGYLTDAGQHVQHLETAAREQRVTIIFVNSTGPAGGGGKSRILSSQGLLCATDGRDEALLNTLVQWED